MKHGRLISLAMATVLCTVLLALGVTKEVPRGGIEGRLMMAERKAPLGGADVYLYQQDETTPDTIRETESSSYRVRRTTADADGNYRFTNLPVGKYKVEVSANAHSTDALDVTVAEAKVATANVSLKAVDPYLEVYNSQKTRTPEQPLDLEIRGFAPDDQVQISVYRLQPGFVAQAGMDAAFRTIRDKRKGTDLAAVSKRVWQTKFRPAKDIEGVFVDRPKIPAQAEGFYWIEVRHGKVTQGTYANVTRLALVAKSTSSATFVYATDITTGRPVSGAQVKIGKEQSRTDASGLARLGRATGGSVMASAGASVAVCSVYSGGGPDKGNLYVYTERPIYRPGDEVHFKGILRRWENGEYQRVPAQTADVLIRDADGKVFERQTVKITPRGTFSGSFKTYREGKPGYFQLVAEVQKIVGSTSVEIAAYRKPDYSVKVTSPQAFYVYGDRAVAEVECKYFHGGPVVGAKVMANVYRNPLWDTFPNDDPDAEDEEPGYFSEGGEPFSTQIEVTTDGNGKARVEFDTRAANDSAEHPFDFNYIVDVSVADSGDRYFSGSGTVRVLRGDRKLAVSTDRYIVRPGTEMKTEILVTGAGDDKPIADATVHVEVGRVIWKNEKSEFRVDRSVAVTTDARGKAVAPITPEQAGYLEIRARTTDTRGRIVRAETSMYAEGDLDLPPGPEGALTVVLDQPRYRVGQTARVMISTRNPGGSAWLTLEAEGIRWQKVVALEQAATFVDLPIRAEDSPNAEVSLTYVKDRTFGTASATLWVQRDDRKLNVSVAPDRKQVQPGEAVAFLVKTTDAKGQPVPAEVSLGVVDEAIYAIRSEAVNIRRAFYPRRPNYVNTQYSFPEIYLDGGDKAPADLKVRSQFRDTAAWFPHVQTDALGQARVSVDLPDNLTTWRATAIGITDASAVGMSTGSVLARKDLMVRVQGPSYLVKGDRQRMTLQLINDTGKVADVNLSLTTKGLKLAEEAPKKLSVTPGTPGVVTLEIEATEAGEAQLEAKAWIGQASDGELRKFNVAPKGRLVTTLQSGQGTDKASAEFNLEATADRDQGGLTVSVTPNIASALVQSIEGLMGFPYGCVEQTMSRFMPAVIVSDRLGKMGFGPFEFDGQIPAFVAEGYARLGALQHEDGSWGWWENDESNPGMTALVLDGIDRAQRAGYPVRQVRMGRALEWAADFGTKTPVTSERLASLYHLAYVQFRLGQTEAARKSLDRLNLTPLGVSENVWAALAYHAMDRPAERDRSLAVLRRMAIQEGPYARWPAQAYSYGEENTSLALFALHTIAPEDPLIPKAVAMLMSERRPGGWSSTRATNYAISALLSYFEAQPNVSGNAPIEVRLNGEVVGTVAANATGNAARIDLPLGKLKEGGNRVELSRTEAGGPFFYSAELKRHVEGDLLAQPGDGLTITRSYHRLEPVRLEDGTSRLLAAKDGRTEFSSGDLVECRLNIRTSRNRQYLLIEDPVPSNFAVTDREGGGDEGWNNWWAQTVIRDDRVAFFVTNLSEAETNLTYVMRAERPGEVMTMPTRIENMYDPAQRAYGASASLRVRP